jgi:hypothetical protein
MGCSWSAAVLAGACLRKMVVDPVVSRAGGTGPGSDVEEAWRAPPTNVPFWARSSLTRLVADTSPTYL